VIRLVHALRRSPNMTFEEFLDWWTNEHAPLVAFHQARLGIGRYVQSYRLTDAVSENAMRAVVEMRGTTIEPAYDGLAEYWWPSESELRAAMDTSAWRGANDELIAHEIQGMDLLNSPIWFAHEYPQASAVLGHVVARPQSGVVKHCFLLRSRRDLDMSQAQQYWHWEHGPLVRSNSLARGRLRYQQVHRYETDLELTFSGPRNCGIEPYFGHGEVWYDRLVSRTGPEVDNAAQRALDDEGNFIDWSRSTIWLNKENVIVDRWG
jgi:EthD domain